MSRCDSNAILADVLSLHFVRLTDGINDVAITAITSKCNLLTSVLNAQPPLACACERTHASFQTLLELSRTRCHTVRMNS